MSQAGYFESVTRASYHAWHNCLREKAVPCGYRIQKISDDPRSEIFHNFLNVIIDGDISIASHTKTKEELLTFNVEALGKKTMMKSVIVAKALARLDPVNMVIRISMDGD